MSLFYETDPADEHTQPQLPPLLQAEAVGQGSDVHTKAVARAAAGAVGLVCYSSRTDMLDMAVTLAPEVPAAQAAQMHHALMIAIGDAIGAAAPPEVSVGYQFPGTLLLNRGVAGYVRVSMAPASGDDSLPAWMVAGLRLRIAADDRPRSLEYRMANSSLEEEGAGFISRTRLLESCCRHFLVWLHRWEGEGFRPLHDLWVKRVDKEAVLMTRDGQNAEWIGLDEEGCGLVKTGGKAQVISLLDADAIFALPELEGAEVP